MGIFKMIHYEYWYNQYLVTDYHFKFDTRPDTILDSFCIISHTDMYLHYLQYNLTHEQVSSVSSV